MANETLTGCTAVIENDIPQTIEEKIIGSSQVTEKDIPQTLQEVLIGVTTAIEKDIPQTLQEVNISTTAVIGQVGEKVNTGIVSTGLTIGKLLGKIFNNYGIVKIAIPNSQAVI